MSLWSPTIMLHDVTGDLYPPFWGRRDRMVVGFTTTCAISGYHHLSSKFEPHSWRGVLDTTLCDKGCQ